VKRLSFLPWRTLVLAAAALAVAAMPQVAGLLRLDRTAVFDGEIWRLWTGHLVHGSAQHLAWNVAALVGLGLLFERALGRHFTWLVFVGGALVGGGVLALQPDVETYLGLSGVLNTIWVGGAAIAARGERGSMRMVYLAAVVAGLAKIVFEAWTGNSIFTDPDALGGQPLVLAHALGSLAGFAIPGAEFRHPVALGPHRPGVPGVGYLRAPVSAGGGHRERLDDGQRPDKQIGDRTLGGRHPRSGPRGSATRAGRARHPS
jgi:rhomboid family GlyGly-CTERM serine protease